MGIINPLCLTLFGMVIVFNCQNAFKEVKKIGVHTNRIIAKEVILMCATTIEKEKLVHYKSIKKLLHFLTENPSYLDEIINELQRVFKIAAFYSIDDLNNVDKSALATYYHLIELLIAVNNELKTPKQLPLS